MEPKPFFDKDGNPCDEHAPDARPYRFVWRDNGMKDFVTGKPLRSLAIEGDAAAGCRAFQAILNDVKGPG